MTLSDILTISVETLSDENKDELYNSLLWLDCSEEDFDKDVAVGLIKVYQDVMKFKGEQVEALIAELDELAIKQGEEEAAKEKTEEDATFQIKPSASSKEYEELEKRYKELKHKYKSLQRKNEDQRDQINKMDERIKEIEEEKVELIKELQNKHSDEESSSDVSERMKEKQTELLRTVHEKNGQISQLLKDIQSMEEENDLLREKVTSLRDNLEEATDHLNSLTQELTSCKANLNDKIETIDSLQNENESLKLRFEEAIDEKCEIEKQTEQLVEELNEKWKEALNEKDKIIKKLQQESQLEQKASSSSDVSDINEKISLQFDVLNRTVIEKDEQIFLLQKQMRSATEEMGLTTKVLEQVTREKKNNEKKLTEFSDLNKELKVEKRNSSERCLDLQKQVEYLEGVLELKTQELNTVFDKLEKKGDHELSQILRESSKMKTNLKFLEKQVSDYVKTCNKLERSVDRLENENLVLREKLDLPVDEEIHFNGIVLKPIRHKKEMRKLQNSFRSLENEKLNLEFENEKLKRAVTKLSTQISNLGTQPALDGVIKVNKPEEKGDDKEKRKELIQENEALRQGLHEIMACINIQKGSPFLEIKSESLERLLKAMDVKHVSGWYHPAMRLQAEVHTLRGGNTELRDQLRSIRLELLKLKSGRGGQGDGNFTEELTEIYSADDIDLPEHVSGKTEKLISYLNKTLAFLIGDCTRTENVNSHLVESLNKFKKDFSIVDAQLKILYDQYISEKTAWEKEKNEWNKEKDPLLEKVAVLEAKLDEYSTLSLGEVDRDERTVEMAEKLVVLNRKCLFLENNEEINRKQLNRLQNELQLSEENALFRIKTMTYEIKLLKAKCDLLTKESEITIDKGKFETTRNNLDNLTIKHRSLLDELKKFKEDHNKALSFLSKTVEELNNEKKELQLKLVDSLSKITEQEVERGDNDLKTISNKLAQCEVNEISERQRANHMTNLYEVVKEQLQKLEERFKESEKYSKELVERNCILQKDLKDFEDKIIDNATIQDFSDLQYKYSRTVDRIEKLILENKKLTEELLMLKEQNSDRYEQQRKDMEILDLKHQLVDLQSMSDEKAMLARLSSDVVLARMSEKEYKKKLEETENDLKETKENYDECRKILAEQKAKIEGLDYTLNNKLRQLEEIVYKKRQQYLGCVPLISEEQFIQHLCQVFRDKQAAFESLQKAQKKENDCGIMKKQLEQKMLLFDELHKMLTDDRPIIAEKIKDWFTEKNTIIANEIKSGGDAKFKDEQLKLVKKRLNTLEEQCIKLEEELFFEHQRNNKSTVSSDKENPDNPEIEFIQSHHSSSLPSGSQNVSLSDSHNGHTSLSELIKTSKTLKKTTETQTVLEISLDGNEKEKIIGDLQNRILTLDNEIDQKNNALSEMRSKIVELEMTLNMFRTQIADKHSQISFYEKHIVDLQNKISNVTSETKQNALEQTNVQETLALQAKINDLEDSLRRKEISLNDLQVVLKNDRDEHSLAALRMQQEVQKLQNIIENQQIAYEDLHQRFVSKEETNLHQQEKQVGKSAIENYISQVHQLEKHANELHTSLSSLTSQLQASREESIRWKSLANERLQNMEQLQQSLEKQHQEEIMSYKQENEKWRKEVLDLQQAITKYRLEFKDLQPDILNKLKEKDDKIHELTSIITNLRFDLRKNAELISLTPKVGDLETKNQQLSKEIDSLKRHLQQTVNREKNAREEIRHLKDQLMKRPVSVKSDRSDKEQHLQKKITTMETEIHTLKEKLNDQILQNESHKLLVADDFDKWKKQKYWQQKAEKLKNKLKEKETELEKLQQTCSGYRILIERLEKEKHALEFKTKNVQQGTIVGDYLKVDELRKENAKLRNDMDNLKAKLHMQQHHSGALGAAMMQEKLEAQERKIAVLELTSKAPADVRSEVERLQSIVSNLQKVNCSIEAENLEKKLDLEKYDREVPQLKDRIQYLENYVEVLKEENSKHVVTGAGDQSNESVNSKKVSELERTIFVLKRVVEKLQVENKRLMSKDKSCAARGLSFSPEKLKSDLVRLRDQAIESTKKIATLEKDLEIARDKIKLLENGEELSRIKSELTQKIALLDKVKVVLCRAASKEKALMEEIALLKQEKSCSSSNSQHNNGAGGSIDGDEDVEKLLS